MSGTVLRMLSLFLLLAIPAQSSAEDASQIAFVDANVVTMSDEGVLHGQTILVEDGKIAAIGSEIAVPDNARRIDARGLWLSPGLADMHTHAHTRDDLAIYLRYGVTTILHMGEASNAFANRTRLAANEGTIAAPHIYTALAVDGSPRYGHLIVTSTEEARAAVLLARINGYSFIKAYNNLSPEVFVELAAAGKEMGIPVIGHTVNAMGGLERQLAEGMRLVAHGEEFIYSYFFPPDVDSGEEVPGDDRIPDAVAMAKRHDAYVTADLITYQTIADQFGNPSILQSWLASREAFLLSPRYRLDWIGAGYANRKGNLQPRAVFLGKLAKAFADGGVPLVSGTDAPTIPGLFIGDSLHRNLALLEAAGLSRYQVLATATRNAGDFIAREHSHEPQFGRIVPDARADMILTSDNPLQNLSVLRDPLGVMAHGVWRDREQLDELMREIADRYATVTGSPGTAGQ